jgi:large subunit ribosomal protein L35
MPKLKTNKTVAKRVKSTKNGKFKFTRAGRRHTMAAKAAKRRRQLRKKAIGSDGDQRRLERLLPYGSH